MYDVWKEKRERNILSLYNKRNIKLLDPRYVDDFVTEFNKKIKETVI